MMKRGSSVAPPVGCSSNAYVNLLRLRGIGRRLHSIISSWSTIEEMGCKQVRASSECGRWKSLASSAQSKIPRSIQAVSKNAKPEYKVWARTSSEAIRIPRRSWMMNLNTLMIRSARTGEYVCPHRCDIPTSGSCISGISCFVMHDRIR